ncbi:SAM-dependent DNA methyltransferase [Shinella pollutisoli]|uniref:SAM-dependent DNA methyltransferase n=1 Tax=Shinella pollutisoli TaxID=2250594 RepID=A0ABV7DI97_9HYPH|nr:SAM-dependent DNA methyltransferase [Shinella pollutisoli]
MTSSARQSSAVMQSRTSPKDALDYFPTPPWAARAPLHELLLPLGLDLGRKRVRDPAAGGGHLLGPLGEVFGAVDYSDVADWGINPPIRDFLFETPATLAADGIERPDWIITNPPFNVASTFFERAITIAAEGVAFFCRLGFLAGQDRYTSIYRPQPVTYLCAFAERVSLIEGAWDPEASSATDYAWFVWIKGMAPQPVFHLPPGMARKYSRIEDLALATPGEAARRAKLRKQGERPDHFGGLFG